MSLLRSILDLDLAPWVFVTAKATLAILIALAAGALFRRARASLRHAVYAALFVLLLLLPLSPRVMPAMNVTVPAQTQTVVKPSIPVAGAILQHPTAAVVRAQNGPRISLRDVLAGLYLGGVFFLLASLIAGIVRLRRVASSGEVWLDGTRLAAEVACANGIRRAVLVVISDEVSVPMTFGFRRQTIVVPATARLWDDGALRRALRHELEHVRRDDWALQLVARVAVAVYWPHPLVWMAWRRFCAEAERACDDAVVRTFEAATYAEQLVGLARTIKRRSRMPALAMASPTRLSERVHAILDPSQRRGPPGRIASVTTVAVMALALVLFGSVRLVAAVIADEKPLHSEDVSGADDESYAEMAVKAGERGSIGRIQELLAHGLDVNHTFDGDGTLLLIAARNGHREAVEFLLDHGADPNVPSPGDGNPLIAAAGHGQADIAALLLDRGARIDEVVPGDENALITASSCGSAEIVRLLIARGANVNLGVLGRRHRRPQPRLAHAADHGPAQWARECREAFARSGSAMIWSAVRSRSSVSRGGAETRRGGW